MSNTAPSDLDGRKQRLERATAEGKDTALTRFALGKILLEQGNSAAAVIHFQRAVELRADYAAAWAQPGRAWTTSGKVDEAMKSYRDGIAVAERLGEIQAALQMKVFLKRLEKRATRP
jgi:Flp pilus assembly protein TadD